MGLNQLIRNKSPRASWLLLATISVGALIITGGTAVAVTNSKTNTVTKAMTDGGTMSDVTIKSNDSSKNDSQTSVSPDVVRTGDTSATITPKSTESIPISPPTTITSPGNTATHTSSTTVTVNGQTTQMDGNTSYDKSYTDDSGSHVSISVHNNTSAESKEDSTN